MVTVLGYKGKVNITISYKKQESNKEYQTRNISEDEVTLNMQAAASSRSDSFLDSKSVTNSTLLSLSIKEAFGSDVSPTCNYRQIDGVIYSPCSHNVPDSISKEKILP